MASRYNSRDGRGYGRRFEREYDPEFDEEYDEYDEYDDDEYEDEDEYDEYDEDEYDEYEDEEYDDYEEVYEKPRRAAAAAGGVRARGGRPQGGGSRGRSHQGGRKAAPSGGRSDRGRASGSRKAAPSKGGKGKKKKKTKVWLFALEFLVLFAMLGVLFVYLKSDSITKDESFGSDESKLQINDELEAQQESASEGGGEWKMAGFKTVALFGVDSRTNSLGKGNRADTIIIASINEDTGDVRLCSVYRDTYINVGNDTYNKANSAYAKGGPEQAIQSLNTSLDLDIRDYGTVNFKALADAIDVLGGVQIDVAEEEIVHLNSYQISMVGREDGKNAFGEIAYTATPGVDYTPVTKSGMQNLNGLQATAYCRIRYVGNDFERTNRQRKVIIAAADKAKSAGIGTLNSAVDQIFPKVMTSFNTKELLGYASNAAKYNIVDSAGFPFDQVTGKMGKAGSCVVAVDFAENVKQLHTFLYGEDDYTPTNRVQEISNKIAADKATYIGN